VFLFNCQKIKQKIEVFLYNCHKIEVLFLTKKLFYIYTIYKENYFQHTFGLDDYKENRFFGLNSFLKSFPEI